MPGPRSWIAIMMASTCLPGLSVAHHSVAGFFDPDEQVIIEGVVTKTTWRNPHVLFEIDVTDDSGEVTTWHIESGALGILRSRGLGHEFLKVGDTVKARGDKSLRGRPEMFARNMLLANGEEVVLTTTATKYFSTQENTEVYEGKYDAEVTEAARQNADGIFRVWSSNLEERPTSGSQLWHGRYAITEAAAAIREQWDPSDNTLQECGLWVMPRLMGNPLPIAFERRGNDIGIRFEEDDQFRIIHMDGEQPSNAEYSDLGYSTGHWEGDTLVVETTNINAGRLDNSGTPFSSEIHLLERFAVSADESRLDYHVTVTDPENFPEPFDTSRYWIWRPEIILDGYSCEQEDRFAEASSE